jgi:hypothetical protein
LTSQHKRVYSSAPLFAAKKERLFLHSESQLLPGRFKTGHSALFRGRRNPELLDFRLVAPTFLPLLPSSQALEIVQEYFSPDTRFLTAVCRK